MDRDKAIIEEAVKRARADLVGHSAWLEAVVKHALALDRSGWQPIDPDVLAVREILAAYCRAGLNRAAAEKFLSGERDAELFFKDALAAYKKHKGNG